MSESIVIANMLAEALTVALPWIRASMAEDRELTPEEEAAMKAAVRARLDTAIAEGEALQRNAT